MNESIEPATLQDAGSARRMFRRDVLRGLRRTTKRLPSKYFYDARGSRLFDEICELPEYYPTRTELAIMEESADEMATAIGPGATLIEYGSGSSLKTRLLLDALEEPSAYLPVDISREHLERAATEVARDYPDLDVRPIAADFTSEIPLPDEVFDAENRRVYFPGSTIGNFRKRQAVRLLQQIHAQVGAGGGLLLGIDLVKDRNVLRAAYNDASGVTARFNLNLLRRINRELKADFVLSQFAHEAIWNEANSRIEMHLRSRRDQTVTIAGHEIDFLKDETICTEYSHKYTQERLEEMADRSGFTVERMWNDAHQWFGVAYLQAE